MHTVAARSPAWLLRSGAAGAASLVAFGAFAGDGARSVSLRVAPGSACADESVLRANLAARGVTVANEGRGWAEAEIDVRTTSEGTLEGVMTFRAEGEEPATRHMEGASCEELAGTLAFAIALAVEPVARPAPSATAPPPPPSATSAPPAASDDRERPPPPRAPAQWSASIFAGTGVEAGSAPAASGTLFVGAELGYGAGIFDPHVALGAGFDLAQDDADFVTARFARQFGRLDACPIRLGQTIAFRPCARLELGRMQAKTIGAAGAALADAVWAAAFVVAQVRLEVLSPAFVFVEVAGGPAMARPAFSFGGREMYAVPALASEASGGVGVHFP